MLLTAVFFLQKSEIAENSFAEVVCQLINKFEGFSKIKFNKVYLLEISRCLKVLEVEDVIYSSRIIDATNLVSKVLHWLVKANINF